MSEKRAVTARQAAGYRAAKGRKERGRIIEGVVRHAGHGRRYAGWLLRSFSRKRLVASVGGEPVRLVVGQRNKRRPVLRPRKYGEPVKRVLVYLWDCFDQMCGKRLLAVLPAMLATFVKRKDRDVAPLHHCVEMDQ